MMNKTQIAVATASAILGITPPPAFASDDTTWKGNFAEFDTTPLEELNKYQNFELSTTSGSIPVPKGDWSWEGKSLKILVESENQLGVFESSIPGTLENFVIDATKKGAYGFYFCDGADTNEMELSAKTISVNASSDAIYSNREGALVQIKNFNSLTFHGGVHGAGSGIVVNGVGSSIELTGNQGSSIVITSGLEWYDHDGALTNKATEGEQNSHSEITLTAGSIRLNEDKTDTGFNGIYNGEKNASVSSEKECFETNVSLESNSNQVYGSYFGIIQNGKGSVVLNAQGGTNLVKLTNTDRKAQDPDNHQDILDPLAPTAIRVQGTDAYGKKGVVTLRGRVNEVNGADGTGIAIFSSGLSEVTLEASEQNTIKGAVISSPNPTSGNKEKSGQSTITFIGNTDLTTSFLVDYEKPDGADNGSGSKTTFSEGLGETSTADYQYTLGILAMTNGTISFEEGTTVKLESKLPTDEAVTDEKEIRERLVWAHGGVVNLNGVTLLAYTQHGETFDANKVGIALVASNEGKVNATKLQVGTRVFGDLVAGISGKIDFELSQGNGSIVLTDSGNVDLDKSHEDITGNVLAANGGEVNFRIGQGVVWSGRVDDYQDADNEKWQHSDVFAPEFSDEITASGKVNLTLDNGAYWNVTGQSWVTTLAGNGGTINLINSDTAEGTAAHALHVQKIEGQHTFVLNLNDTNHSLSDMLYIQTPGTNAETQTIRINSLEGLENMAHNDRIRFATVNTSEDGLHFETEVSNSGDSKTRTLMRDVGFYDVGFRIEHETRSTDKKEDGEYNGEDLDLSKPGNDWVDDHYAAEDAQNWYLVRDQSLDETSNTGETILATARSAYWNAIEIDRLNKRLGDARHAEGGTEGFWIRVRNDRIGTDRSTGNFRSRNYAYQFGYDHSKREDDGKRLFGAALDYMDGNTTYRDVEGTGATDRFGLTAYMTWLGDNGWYYDLVGKWGVLSNSFRLATDTGSRVSADYDNHVLGVSFEFGRKFTKDDSLWFVEPQTQIQHVMVTEASYNTNQGTAVEQDKINSTITRLGLRFGRNFGEKANGIVYAKADWLKEWHGHQGITVTDKTTGMTAADVSIENKGDWFDAGFGIQSPISKTTYFFADAEYVFGNHLDNTWNFNASVRWMFH